MDGNGRWAQQRNLPRLEGHRASRQSIRETIETCDDLGIGFLTLYTFSAENWNRPETEVRALMALIEHTLREESVELHRRKSRVRLLGDLDPLPQSLKDEIARVETLTEENPGLTLQLAINYGGRQEILHAVSEIAKGIAAGHLSPADVSESVFTRHLYRPDTPDPDLLVRTGGEFRVSNYLLWQMSYTEFYFTPVLWPEFRQKDLKKAVEEYQHRNRKFGGLPEVQQ